jgi:hypothetical protein
MANFVEQYSGSIWNYSLLAINVLVTSTQLPIHVEDLFVSGYIYALVAYILSFYVIRKNIDTLQKLPEAKTLLKKELWYWNLVAFILDIAFLIGLFVSNARREDFPGESIDDSTIDSRRSTRGAEESASLDASLEYDERAQARQADARQAGNYDVFVVGGAALVPASATGLYYTYQDDPRAAASEEKYPEKEKRAPDSSAGFTPIGTPIDLVTKGRKGWVLRALESQGREKSRAQAEAMTVENAIKMFASEQARKKAEAEARLQASLYEKRTKKIIKNQEMRLLQAIQKIPPKAKFTEEDLIKAWNTIPANISPEERSYLFTDAPENVPKWASFVANEAYKIRNPPIRDDDIPIDPRGVYDSSSREPTMQDLEQARYLSEYPLGGRVPIIPSVRLSNRQLREYGLPQPPQYSASYALPRGPMLSGTLESKKSMQGLCSIL